MQYQTIAKAGPSPEKMKDRVKRSEPLSYIKTDSAVYKIKWGELRNMALDNYGAVETLSASLGHDDVGFMAKSCLTCNFNGCSAMNYFFGSGAKPSVGNDDCNYPGKKGVRIASTWTERNTGKTFYAEYNPCVIDETMVHTLENLGKLKPYQTTEEYKFLPLSAFEAKEALPDNFKAPRPSLKSRLLDLLNI